MNITKLQKALKLLKIIKKEGDYSWEHWKIKNNKLYYASWDVDPHNGDIDDYEENLAKESDISDCMLQTLENEVFEIMENLEKEQRKQAILKKIYE